MLRDSGMNYHWDSQLISQFREISLASKASLGGYWGVFDTPFDLLPTFVSLLVNSIIDQSKSKERSIINIHAQGFIRFNITDPEVWKNGMGLRFHIWHPKLRKPFSTPYDKQHRHSFESDSIVLLGDKVSDRLFAERAATLSDIGVVRLYETTPSSITPSRYVILKEVASRTARRTQLLHYPRQYFHLHGAATSPTATVFYKYEPDTENPLSETVGPLVPIEDPKNLLNPRSTLPNQAEMWSYVLSAAVALVRTYLGEEHELVSKVEGEMRRINVQHHFFR
jgi:hypothetical protein